jgi:hypothetical protein
LIDERGRLFGKINIIDFLVVIFFLVIVPLLYLAYQQIIKPLPPQVLPKEFVDFEMESKLKITSPGQLDLIKVGDKEIGKDGQVVSEITWIGTPENYTYEFDIGKNSSAIVVDPLLKSLPVKIRLKAEAKDNQLYFQDQRIYKDAKFDFITDKYTLEFQENIDIVPEEKWIGITVKFPSLGPELSNIINAGDEEKVQKGKIIARITSMISNEPAKVAILKFSSGDKLITVDNPYTYDVLVGMQVLATIKKHNLYFKNSPLKIGAGITFSTNNYIINGIITQVYEGKN